MCEAGTYFRLFSEEIYLGARDGLQSGNRLHLGKQELETASDRCCR